jgi:multiple sugar transport system permease protein
MSAAAPAVALERRKPPAAVRRRRLLISVADHSLLIAVSIMFLAPFVFIVLTSLMTNDQALSPRLWPSPFRWANYTDVFHTAPIWRYGLNTTIYAVLATVGVLVSSIPVAYALSRLRWRGRDVMFILVLVAFGTCLAAVSGWRYARVSAPVNGPIILVSIDTLRADHLGCYGYFRATSPCG